MEDVPLLRKTRPEPGEVRVLVALDIDGVLNRLGGDDPGVMVEDPWARRFPIRPVADEILDALDEVTRRDGVALGWLTTWGLAVQRVITQALNGRLKGGYVISEPPTVFGQPSRAWKYGDLRDEYRRLGEPAVAWMEDMDITLAAVNVPGFLAGDELGGEGQRPLLIEPDPRVGVTMQNAERLGAFVDKHVG